MLRFLMFLFMFLLLNGHQTFAQSHRILAEEDANLTIKKIAFLPLQDNLSGIYSRNLSTSLKEQLEADRQWTLVDVPTELYGKPEQFEDDPEKVKAIYKATQADALVTGRISKGPAGISFSLSFFAGKEGFALIKEGIRDFSGFEIAELKDQLALLVHRLKTRLPYRGLVLSRRGQMVTLNLGMQAGLQQGSEVSAIQILKVHRHPKHNFMISADSNLIGKIIIDKVDEYLSFGTIVAEREANAIRVDTKLVPVVFQKYQVSPKTSDGKILDKVDDRKDKDVAFGDNPQEWMTVNSPSFGKVGLLLGAGSYSINNNLSVGSSNANATMVPSIHLEAELWFNPNWYMDFGLRQYVFQITNPYPGGASPSKLGVASTEISLEGGYNFLITDQFFGPKVQLGMGFGRMSSTVDEGTPLALTNNAYSAMLISLGASFPVELESRQQLALGGKLLYWWRPRMEESPVTSGEVSGTTVANFLAFGHYRLTERMRFKGELIFSSYSSRLSNSGNRGVNASSISHSIVTLAGGLEFMF